MLFHHLRTAHWCQNSGFDSHQFCASHVKMSPEELRVLWHKRLAHPCPQYLDKLDQRGHGAGFASYTRRTPRPLVSLARTVFRERVAPPFPKDGEEQVVPITEPLQLLHADTAGRISTPGGLR
jgi:hypothetical protein